MVNLYDQKITKQKLYHNPTQIFFPELIPDEMPPANNADYSVGSDKSLAFTGLSASVNEDKRRAGTGNSLESIGHAHARFLKYKTIKCLDLDKMIWLMVLSAIVP